MILVLRVYDQNEINYQLSQGSASRASGAAGWRVHVQLQPDTAVNLWGPVVTDRN